MTLGGRVRAISGVLLLVAASTCPASANTSTLFHGLHCVPYGNPTASWTNISTTGAGPANHNASAANLMCPSAFPFPVNSGTQFGGGAAVLDRNPSASVTMYLCAVNSFASSSVCSTVASSGSAYTGGYALAQTLVWPIAQGDTGFLIVSLPAISSGNVSHVVNYSITENT